MPHRSARALTAALLAAVTVIGGSLIGSGAAVADETVPDPVTTSASDATAAPTDPASLIAMRDFTAEAYESRVTEVPAELAAVLADDLGETPAGYLANADAAANAVAVVDGLSASGVEVLGSRLDGTALVVNVADEADAAAVEAVNATAEIGEPTTPDIADEKFTLKGGDLVGGQGYFSQDADWLYFCSVAFNGADKALGQEQFLTAGHCRVPGTFNNGQVTELVQNRPDDAVVTGGDVLGQPIDSSFAFGNGLDAGLVATGYTWTAQPSVGVWGTGNDGPVTSGSRQPVYDYGDSIVGQDVCKSGRTTGWTCGTVIDVDYPIQIEGSGASINTDVVEGMCSLGGDSGGAIVSGGYAMGLLSAGTYDDCSQVDELTAFFPMIAAAGRGSVTSSETNWVLHPTLSVPVVNQPVDRGTLAWGVPISGTLPHGSFRNSVTVWIDGQKSYTARVAQDSTWSVLATDLADGVHSYSVNASFGAGEAVFQGSSGGGIFTSTGHPAVSRIAGADRYDGAVKIAQASYPDTADVVYVATGQNYPDALSAGPAAVAEEGPLLLVTQNQVPDVVAKEITSLAPGRIVVVGGPNSVSDAVLATLGTLVPGVEVQRLSGVDRYAASRTVVDTVFTDALTHAYAATGTNFPDALSAGGAAGSALEPVVLVNGSLAAADAPTLELFRDLGVQDITVVGGANSVSEGVKSSLASVPASVERESAADRFETSIAVNQSAFDSAGTVYLATGLNFPDALAGGVLAGTSHAPLYVVPTDCVPTGVLSDITRLGATRVVLIGGSNSLAAAVENLTACAG